MELFGSHPRQLIDDLRTFITDEFAMQRRKYREQQAEPQATRVENGTCFDKLKFESIDARGHAKFQHPGNDSRMREADLVRLSHVSLPYATKAIIFREDEQHLWLAADGAFQPRVFAEAADWLIDEDFLDLESHYLSALDRLPTTTIGQERILPLLAGTARPSLDEEEYRALLTAFGHSSARENQAIA